MQTLQESTKHLDGRRHIVQIFIGRKRRCAMCREYKLLKHFHKSLRMPGGVNAYCKPCIIKYREKFIGPDSEQRRKYQRFYYLKNKIKLAEYKKQWAKNNGYKTSASLVVNGLVKKGEIIKPDSCGSCGIRGEKIHAHHPDYNFPLRILWLCKSCHQIVHRRKPK